jgi:hypothetical protein
MKKFIKIILISLTLNFLFSQISSEGTPKSILIELDKNIPTIKLASIDFKTLELEDRIEQMDKSIPFRFGSPIEVNYDLNNSGEWTDTELGRIWRLSITSESAYSINLLYDRFILPEGAEMYLYDNDMTTILGAFTIANNKDHQTFSTSPTKGSTTIIEYFEPYDVDFNGEISINSVVHGYKDVFFNETRGYGDSGSCNNNVNCAVGEEWSSETRSVAMILTSGGSRLCTGALINNARQDLTPYFLTANHCLGGESNWLFMFNYESSGCTNQNGPTSMTVSGSTLLVNSSPSDVALLELDENPPLDWEVHYSGWDANPSTPSTPVCIHHPSGDIKKISFDYQNPTTDGQLWRIGQWEDGTTEPGSSGSPLFDGVTQRIVGQLYGGAASCTVIDYDVYGKFSTSWNVGLSNYLDPDNTGITFIDGIDAIDLPDPELVYNAPNLELELNVDETEIINMTISNVGELESELNYSIGSSPFETIGSGPDGENYFWTDSDIDNNTNYEWIDIANSGTIYPFPNNDGAGQWVPLDFSFPFYGNAISNTSYNQLFINANGWVGFESDSDAWDNTTIPSSQISGAAIFPLWDDLNPINDNCNEYCAGNVYYHSNSERFVIWFDQVAHWYTNFPNTSYDFQVVLYPSGKIDINYRNLTGGYDASVGIQKDGTVGSQVIFGTDELSNNLNITFNKGPDWLTISPNQGSILEGQSENITLNVNTNNLADGVYDAFINILSNGGNVSLPLNLMVNGSLLGDTNGDDVLNVLDVIALVNMVLGNSEPDLSSSDMNDDGLLSVLDIIALLNIILE